MLARDSLLATVLREPHRLGLLSSIEWDVLLPQARRAGMLARLAWVAEGSGATKVGRPGEYLEGARVISRRQAQAVHFEVERIHAAFGGTGIPVILLKGASYEMAALPCAVGRIFADIDLLVSHEHLETAEKVLRFHSWARGTTHLTTNGTTVTGCTKFRR